MPKTTKKTAVKKPLRYAGQLAESSSVTPYSSPKMDLFLVTQLAEWARQNDCSFTEALEAAVSEFLWKRQSLPEGMRLAPIMHMLQTLLNYRRVPVGQAERVRELIDKNRENEDVREFMPSEINEWEELDQLSPELKEKVGKLEALPSPERKVLFDNLAERLRKERQK